MVVQGRPGELEPFVLVVEGSIPNEAIKEEGYWAGSAPIPRPASRSPRASGSTGSRRRRWPSSRSARARRTAASTRWPATRPARWACPTTSAGTCESKAGLPIVCVPGCPVQPDNFSGDAALPAVPGRRRTAPLIPLDEALRPDVALRQTVHEGCDRGGYYEQADFAASTARKVHREARLLGPGRHVQRAQARMDQRRSAAARTSAASASAARCPASPTSSCRSWTSRRAQRCRRSPVVMYGGLSARCADHREHRRQGTAVAACPARSSRPATDRTCEGTGPRGPRSDQADDDDGDR